CHSAQISYIVSVAPRPAQTSTLSLHDALPISQPPLLSSRGLRTVKPAPSGESTKSTVAPSTYGKLSGSTATEIPARSTIASSGRSEEHTSELQSLRHLVCRLLLEKKKRIPVRI